MIPVEHVVQFMLSQDGDDYVFGAEASPDDANPDAFDCSELVQWASNRAHVDPFMIDGARWQCRHCRNYGTIIEVTEGLATRGALLFKFPTDPFVMPGPTWGHVAMSLGNGQTIEARSSYYGVGVFSAYGRGWTHAARIPGCDYVGILPPIEEESMIEQGHSVITVVVDIQTWLIVWNSEALPRYGADGDYGGETTLWVSKFQTAQGIPATGKVDGLTHSLLEKYGTGGQFIHDHDFIVEIPAQTVRGKTEDAS